MALSPGKVGGSLNEILTVEKGLKTLPAVKASGKPAAPTTSSFGSQPLPSKAFNGLVVTFLAPCTNGKYLMAFSLSSSATSYNYLYLFGGTSIYNSLVRSPVSES